MSDRKASENGEEMNLETAMAAVDGPHAAMSTIMRPPGKVYPLSSSRLAADVLKQIAVQLELPGTASRADAQLILEGKIQGLGHEPRNVQVRITEGKDSAQLVELMDAEGAFLRVDSLEDGEKGETDLTEMVIETGDSPPQRVPAHRMPLAVRQEVAGWNASSLNAQIRHVT